mgnify:CR=1 FL=1
MGSSIAKGRLSMDTKGHRCLRWGRLKSYEEIQEGDVFIADFESKTKFRVELNKRLQKQL